MNMFPQLALAFTAFGKVLREGNQVEVALVPAAPVITGVPTVEIDAPALAAPEMVAAGLLRRWLELSELERRAFGALSRELGASSDLVERSTLELSDNFQALAVIAQAQIGRVDRVIAVASVLRVDGEVVSLDDGLASVETSLKRAVETILFVSKQAMRMVYMLDTVTEEVANAEECSNQIEAINRQARYLALNAAIEASRAGGDGGAFAVIAHEMKMLSQATASTALQVHDRIAAVATGVRRSHELLREVATLDLSENIMAKERIGSLLAGIICQHNDFHAVLAETAESSAALASTIGQLVTGIQFQDRTKQHITQVIETMAVLEQAGIAVRDATESAYPTVFPSGGIDDGVLASIVEKQTLGGMKSRLLTQLLGGEEDREETGGSADGDVELF